MEGEALVCRSRVEADGGHGEGKRARGGERACQRGSRERGGLDRLDRESRGGLNGRGHGAPWAASTDALGRAYRGERREVLEGAGSVPCPGRRGHLGRHHPDAQGCRMPLAWVSYSAGAHCSALQSAHMAVQAIFYACGRALACPVVFGGAKEGILALDALGGQWVNREKGYEWKWGCPEWKLVVPSP